MMPPSLVTGKSLHSATNDDENHLRIGVTRDYTWHCGRRRRSDFTPKIVDTVVVEQLLGAC